MVTYSFCNHLHNEGTNSREKELESSLSVAHLRIFGFSAALGIEVAYDAQPKWKLFGSAFCFRRNF